MMRVCSAVLLALTAIMLIASPAAATSQPDSNPTISGVHANTYLLAEGDILIYGRYNIPYASIPDDAADDTYIISLIDTDNATFLGSVTPFAYFDSDGYNEGAFGLYFSAADNLTSDQNYTIRISQNPAFFDDARSFDYIMESNAWTDETEQDDNQLELRLNIISIAEDLESAHDVTLLESSVGGTVLSDPYGETYFRGAIYGIQAMAPDLFLVQSLEWDTTDRVWTTEQFDDYATRLDDTFIGDATEATSEALGLGSTQTLMTLIYCIPIIVGAVIISKIKWRGAEPAYLVAPVVIILCGLMGWIDPAIFALIFQVMVMYIGYLWFYARAGDSLGGKYLNFLGFVWICSTLICLVIEGSWVGSTEATVVNDLSAFGALKIGGLIPIPAPNLYFFRGVFRVLLFDYSFYTGSFEIVRYIYLTIFTSSAIYLIGRDFASVFANFLRIR